MSISYNPRRRRGFSLDVMNISLPMKQNRCLVVLLLVIFLVSPLLFAAAEESPAKAPAPPVPGVPVAGVGDPM